MATKHDDSCFQRAEDDEPLFTLLARDPDAPFLVELWADLREERGGVTPQTTEARECAAQMRAWRAKNRPRLFSKTLTANAWQSVVYNCYPEGPEQALSDRIWSKLRELPEWDDGSDDDLRLVTLSDLTAWEWERVRSYVVHDNREVDYYGETCRRHLKELRLDAGGFGAMDEVALFDRRLAELDHEPTAEEIAASEPTEELAAMAARWEEVKRLDAYAATIDPEIWGNGNGEEDEAEDA